LRIGALGCTAEAVLPFAIGRFKTPAIRDLGQSQPYFHSGQFATIEQVLQFYISATALARARRLRNGDPAMAEIRLDETDVAPLASFLRSLNEDYH
jgi:cytochrome c peroxidase